MGIRNDARRELIAGWLNEGVSRAEIARRLGVAKPTITYYCNTLGIPPEEQCGRRYDWAEVQRYYDEGHSVRDCIRHFGFSSETWHQARKRGDVVTRPQAMDLDELLSKPRNRQHVKIRLVRAGLKTHNCEACGLSHWQGKLLALQLHHRNGDGKDNRLENLQFLCPNCHSQTENWGGRNKRRPRAGGETGSERVVRLVQNE